jgi:hypothetical protein
MTRYLKLYLVSLAAFFAIDMLRLGRQRARSISSISAF